MMQPRRHRGTLAVAAARAPSVQVGGPRLRAARCTFLSAGRAGLAKLQTGFAREHMQAGKCHTQSCRRSGATAAAPPAQASARTALQATQAKTHQVTAGACAYKRASCSSTCRAGGCRGGPCQLRGQARLGGRARGRQRRVRLGGHAEVRSLPCKAGVQPQGAGPTSAFELKRTSRRMATA